MKLRPSDFVVGSMYFSPSGRLCKLVEHTPTLLRFAYISRSRGRALKDEFLLSRENLKAVSAMTEFLKK